jgi:hypothetical protein
MADSFETRATRRTTSKVPHVPTFPAREAPPQMPGGEAAGPPLRRERRVSSRMPERGTAEAVARELGAASLAVPRGGKHGATPRGSQSIAEQNLTSCEE